MSATAERIPAAALDADRNRDLMKLEKVIEKVVGAMETLSKENGRLRMALDLYGQHKAECDYWQWMNGRCGIMICTCGLNEEKRYGK